MSDANRQALCVTYMFIIKIFLFEIYLMKLDWSLFGWIG